MVQSRVSRRSSSNEMSTKFCLQDQYEFLHRALSTLFKRQLAWQEDHGYMNWPSAVSQSYTAPKPDLVPNKNGSSVELYDSVVGVAEEWEQPKRLPVVVKMPEYVKQARTPSPEDTAPSASPSTLVLDGMSVPGQSRASL